MLRAWNKITGVPYDFYTRWLNFTLWKIWNSVLIGFLWASCAHKFSLAKMASEVQKPPAKMEFLLVCG